MTQVQITFEKTVTVTNTGPAPSYTKGTGKVTTRTVPVDRAASVTKLFTGIGYRVNTVKVLF